MMKNYGIPVAAEGWPFILPLAGITVLCFLFGWKNTGYVSLALALFVLFFFIVIYAEGRGRILW